MTESAHDPMDALRMPITPVDPDPEFADRLRHRLQDTLIRGGTMTTQGTAPLPTEATETVEAVETVETVEPPWPPSVVPYIIVRGAREAIDWYVDVFGGERRGEPYVMPDGKIGHAEIGIGNAVLMLADEMEGYPAPTAAPGMGGYRLQVQVPDVDATVARAIERGAELYRPVADEPYGRYGGINDPFGHSWLVSTPPPFVSTSRPGDIIYHTIWADDGERAKAFYTEVLGARVQAGATNPTLSFASRGEFSPEPDGIPVGVPVFRVANVDTALERVRAAGGQAREPEQKPYGRIADCTDPEGVPFSIWEPPR